MIKIKSSYIMGMIFFLYVLTSYGTSMLAWPERFVQIPLYAFLAYGVFSIFMDKKIELDVFNVWYILFVFLCLISAVITDYVNSAKLIFAPIFMTLLFGIALSAFLKKDGALKIVKYTYILLSIPIGIALIVGFQQEHWWSRLGENFGMNANIVGLYFLIPYCFAIIELYEKRHRLISIAAIAISVYTILLTGSKKALFGIVLFVVVYLLLRGKNVIKKVVVIIAIVAFIILGYNLIMKIPQLYDIVGFRMEMFFDELSAEDVAVQGSTIERRNMIQFGISKFFERPLFGFGINSFQELYGKANGFYAYAHNNYIELLVDMGIIGFVAYYGIFIKIFSKPYVFNKSKEIAAEVVAFSVLVLFYDIAMVSYSDIRIIMLVCMILAQKKKLMDLPDKESENPN